MPWTEIRLQAGQSRGLGREQSLRRVKGTAGTAQSELRQGSHVPTARSCSFPTRLSCTIARRPPVGGADQSKRTWVWPRNFFCFNSFESSVQLLTFQNVNICILTLNALLTASALGRRFLLGLQAP